LRVKGKHGLLVLKSFVAVSFEPLSKRPSPPIGYKYPGRRFPWETVLARNIFFSISR
jgi:hypothetical protein